MRRCLGDPSCLWQRKYRQTDIHVQRYTCVFPWGSAGKESTYNAGDMGSIPGLGRFSEEGKGLPTPVFWPGEFHGLYSPWGRKESDTTELLSLRFRFFFFKNGGLVHDHLIQGLSTLAAQ